MAFDFIEQGQKYFIIWNTGSEERFYTGDDNFINGEDAIACPPPKETRFYSYYFEAEKEIERMEEKYKNIPSKYRRVYIYEYNQEEVDEWNKMKNEMRTEMGSETENRG